MAWQNEILIRDVVNAGTVVSDRIGREMTGHLDLEESLEASRYASHPYSTYPREVLSLFVSILFVFVRVCVWIFFFLKLMWARGLSAQCP